MKETFDAEFKDQFVKAGLLKNTGGELAHLISDAATMQILRWADGGFGMACHNYDGDMLTDEVAQVHRSPGFITSCLIGKASDGRFIKEYEASHGTVADLWHAHLRGEETSMNPLGMVVALLDAMNHAAVLDSANQAAVKKWTASTREAMYKAFREGKGTRDMAGPEGLTTEGFVAAVRQNLDDFMAADGLPEAWSAEDVQKPAMSDDIDVDRMRETFNYYDKDGDDSID